jgi:hypothetical protein
MIINNLDLMWTVFAPNENQAPLPVDPDGVLAAAVASQDFQPVARRKTKILQTLGGVQRGQVTSCHNGEVFRHATRQAANENLCGNLVPEAPYHFFT